LADEQGFQSIALPGLGTGVGRVFPQEAAREMILEIQRFNPECLQSIVLIDIDPIMVQAWRDFL